MPPAARYSDCAAVVEAPLPTKAVRPSSALAALAASLASRALPFLAAASAAGSLLLDHLDRSAGLLDRLERALRRAGDLEASLGLELALAEQAHAVLAAAGQARRLQRVMVDHALGVELAGVDQLLDRAQVHLGIVLGEDVVEAALRQPHVERHLAALEALDGHARAALLALLAAAAGLALARADAASDADAALAGARIVADVVEFHVMSALAFAFVAHEAGG